MEDNAGLVINHRVNTRLTGKSDCNFGYNHVHFCCYGQAAIFGKWKIFHSMVKIIPTWLWNKINFKIFFSNILKLNSGRTVSMVKSCAGISKISTTHFWWFFAFYVENGLNLFGTAWEFRKEEPNTSAWLYSFPHSSWEILW